MTRTVLPGSVWRHSKTGNLYTVLMVAVWCGKEYSGSIAIREGDEIVVYVGHYDSDRKPEGGRPNRIYTRPVEEWTERVTIGELEQQVVDRYTLWNPAGVELY